MRVTGILLGLLAMAMAAVAAQSADPTAGSYASSHHVMEPIWMILSGAALLVVASAVRRLAP